MLIGNKFKVGSDSSNIIVYQRHGKNKDGSDKWCAEAYFATIKNALRYLVDTEVRETGLVDLKTVVQKQDSLYELIKSLKIPGDLGETAPEPSPRVLQELPSTQDNVEGCNTLEDREMVGDVVLKHPGGRPHKDGEVSRTTDWRRRKESNQQGGLA